MQEKKRLTYYIFRHIVRKHWIFNVMHSTKLLKNLAHKIARTTLQYVSECKGHSVVFHIPEIFKCVSYVRTLPTTYRRKAKVRRCLLFHELSIIMKRKRAIEECAEMGSRKFRGNLKLHQLEEKGEGERGDGDIFSVPGAFRISPINTKLWPFKTFFSLQLCRRHSSSLFRALRIYWARLGSKFEHTHSLNYESL